MVRRSRSQRTLDIADDRQRLLQADGQSRVAIRNEIIDAHAGLITTITERLRARYSVPRAEFSDLRNEVVVACICVLDTDDGDGQIEAKLWSASQQAVRRARDTNTGWGSATRASRTLAAAGKAESDLWTRLRREPTNNEIADEIGVEPDELAMMRSRLAGHHVDATQAADAGAAVITIGESAAFIDQMADMLESRDHDIAAAFRARFGLDNDPPPDTVPWANVSDHLGVSIVTAQRRVARGRQMVAEWIAAA